MTCGRNAAVSWPQTVDLLSQTFQKHAPILDWIANHRNSIAKPAACNR